MLRRFLFSAVFCTCSSTLFAAGQFVPFVIPAEPKSDSVIGINSWDAIDVRHERLTARRAHFFCKEDRVRLWGVNLSFAANFPSRKDARHIAARLAHAGVNTVRCHHMDTALWPRGIWDEREPTRLKAEALDRLDYFIDQLARHGIWVNINLHVGREHSKYIGLPKVNRKYDKISCLFTPQIIEAQKHYARDLLTHVNRYRNVQYADDPAVAIIEITNENSFFMWAAEDTLRTLPEFYRKILEGQYNAWLGRKYGSDRKAQAAWAAGVEPPGENLLENGVFRDLAADGTPSGWNIEQHEACRASTRGTTYKSKRALRVDIERIDETDWHLQLTGGGFALEKGKYYTLAFDAAAESPREIRCGVSQAHSPWGNLGLSQTARLTERWKTWTLGFVARQSDDTCRISFTLGQSKIPLYLANVQLRPGGRVGLGEGESIEQGTVRLYGHNESPARALDRMIFLAETEKRYFDDMRSFIREDLDCDALVTGTIVFGPLGLYGQSDMDFIDAHAYWQHPRFPGRPWDRGNWLINQKPMVDHPDEAPLFRLAAQRLKGKPYTVSEYNHPAPLDSQAECVPLISSFAAMQDWDGIWLYTYSHSGDEWGRDHLNGFFDIDTNPAKWGFMRAGTAIFREKGLNPLSGQVVVRLGQRPDMLADVAELHMQYDRDMWDLVGDRAGALERTVVDRRVYVSFESELSTPAMEEPQIMTAWEVEDGKGGFMAAGGAGVLAGHRRRILELSEGYAEVKAPEFCAITATALDGRPWFRSDEILITACGRCENTDMEFSKDRQTVGRQWGHGPVRIETVEGRIIVPDGNWKCRALEPDGTVGRDVPIRSKGGRTYIEIGPQYETMWYFLSRE